MEARGEGGDLPGAYGPALHSSLLRLIDDFEDDYIGGRPREIDLPEALDEAAARQWLAAARGEWPPSSPR